MKMFEDLEFRTALAPASIATATETATGYIDARGANRLAFCFDCASIGNGKAVAIDVYSADDANGTNAAKVSDGSWTTPAAGTITGPFVVDVDIKKPFYCAKITQSSGSGVVIGCVAVLDMMYRPADNDFTAEA